MNNAPTATVKMSVEELDKLESLAKAAARGPWTYNRTTLQEDAEIAAADGTRVANLLAGDVTYANSEFIAAAHPGTILALIAQARASLPVQAEAPSDPVVEANRKLLLERSRVGINKYGVTLADAGLSRAQLAQHALEEALDLANYLQTIIQADAATPEQSDTTKGQA